METGFDIKKYLVHSKKVEVSDVDFSVAPRYSLTESEIRCLTYMMDVESHTIVFLKGKLSTCAITDPETTAFLTCWAYEEFFHGRTLRQFLQATGVDGFTRRNEFDAEMIQLVQNFQEMADTSRGSVERSDEHNIKTRPVGLRWHILSLRNSND